MTAPLQITMMSCARTGAYACSSIASMFARDAIDARVTIVVDGDDPTYLEGWESDSRVEVDVLERQVAESRRRDGVLKRIRETFMRCVKVGVKGEGGLVLLQDDVRFACSWLATTRRCAALVHRRLGYAHGRDVPFVLALYAADMTFKSKPVAPYPHRRFWGNVGLYFSPRCVAELHEYLVDTTEVARGGDDIWLKRYIATSSAELFVVNPNVVQHCGDQSTHGGRQHRSATFVERAYQGRWPNQ